MTRQNKIFYWSAIALIYAVGWVVLINIFNATSLSMTSRVWLDIVSISIWTFILYRFSRNSYRLILEEDRKLGIIQEEQSKEPAYVTERAAEMYNHSITKSVLKKEWKDLSPRERKAWIDGVSRP